MSFRLKEATYKVRCREPGCSFFSEFVVKENLMGVTEADIDSEAIKIAKNLAFIKHDALLGRKHPLANPDIFKISSSYERIGGLTAPSVHTGLAQGADTFHRGQVIMKKQESRALACEVVRGSAFNEGHPNLRYRPGAIIGSAAMFHQKSRPANLLAAEDNTVVTFHEVSEVTRSNPAQARELYDHALQDLFHVLLHLEEYSASLEKKLKRLASAPRKPARPRTGARTRAKSAAPARKKAKPARMKTAGRAKARRG